MLNRAIARGLMGIVPERFTATVTLLPESISPTVLTCYQCWFKPVNVTFATYGNVAIQGDETLLKVPDDQLNPANNGREIRPRDLITVDGIGYNVISARLMSERTVWECLVRKSIV
jgi:hypothetical protein